MSVRSSSLKLVRQAVGAEDGEGEMVGLFVGPAVGAEDGEGEKVGLFVLPHGDSSVR